MSKVWPTTNAIMASNKNNERPLLGFPGRGLSLFLRLVVALILSELSQQFTGLFLVDGGAVS